MDTPQRTVIVGGVAGGMSAATRLRRLDEKRDIVVFERGSHVSFANCGLPYYVGGVIPDRSSLLLQTPESLAARFALDVRVRHEVTSIDPVARVVYVTDLSTGESSPERYDSLVLAAGASASRGPTASRDLTGAALPTFHLRSVDDVDHITAVLDALEGRGEVVVIGAGFIGLEAVENLVERGCAVTLVQRGAHVLSPLDAEMAAPVLDLLLLRGVDVRTGTTVVGHEPGFAVLSDGSRIRADLVVEASGVHPELALARSAGLDIGRAGGIAVDAQQRTSDPAIFAVGDGVEKVDAIDREPTLVTMAGLANRHGRSAADAIAGHGDDAWPALGTSILGLFGRTIAMVGWSEKRLIAAGRAHRVIHTHPASHATYYPGAETMALKLLVDPADDAILGAQIVGGEGVDKRIDVIATAMAGALPASALSRLELAYAPQFGSAKDAVNMAGYVADNLATGATVSIQWHELAAALAAGDVLVDVRTAGEFSAGSMPGALNLPLDEIRERHGEVAGHPIIVHCQVGQRGHTATRLLAQLGHEVRNLDGGYKTWTAGISTLVPADAPAPRTPTLEGALR